MRDTTEAQRWDTAFLKSWSWDFPGSPAVKTLSSDAEDEGSVPVEELRVPHASWSVKQNTKQKQQHNKFNRDFKNGPYQKNL